MAKKIDGITRELFTTAILEFKKKLKWVGGCEDKETMYGVYTYPNGASLKITYWKNTVTGSGMVLACAKDNNGIYCCLNSNVRSIGQLTEIVEQFDWRAYDAKREKQWTRVSFNKTQETSTEKQEIAGILEQLNSI